LWCSLNQLTSLNVTSLAISYTSSDSNAATMAGGNIHITGAGTTDITVSQEGNSNYNPAASVVQTLTVNKAILTVTADNKTRKSETSQSKTNSFVVFVITW
jgi:hypothetical protein